MRGKRWLLVEGEAGALLLSLGRKKGGNSFPWKKIGKFMAGIGIRIKKMAGTHIPIGIGKQIGKMGSKKGPESGIPLDFPTKIHCREEILIECLGSAPKIILIIPKSSLTSIIGRFWNSKW